MRWLVAGLLVLPAAATVAAPENPPADVTPKDWSYQAVEDLAGRGLVHGYKDAKFLGGKKLSRFEMATLVKRVIDSLLEIPAPDKDEPFVPETPGTAASRGQGVEPPPLGRSLPSGRSARTAAFTESDLGTVKRLTDEYSVELAVIGVNLQEAVDRMAALEGRVEALETGLRDPKGPLQTAISNLARIDKIRFSGYVQARFDSFEHTREADPAGSRVPVVNRFDLRRMRMTVRARPTPHVAIKWELEGAGQNMQSRDAFITYFLKGNPATGHGVSFGQLKVPFGFEIPQSSGAREVPERAKVIRFFFPSERDRGITISSPTGKRWFYEVGVFNGVIGPGMQGIGTSDNNNDKTAAGRIRTTQLRGTLDAGVSFFVGNQLRTALFAGEPGRPGGNPSGANPYENKRLTLGTDVQWHPRKGTEFRFEALWGKAFGSYASGYILEALQDIGARNQFVVRYDWLGIDDTLPAPLGGGGTPVGDAVPYRGTLSTLAIGMIHRLDPSVRLKLFYEFNGHSQERLEYGRVPWQGNMLRFEVLTLF